MFGSCAAVARNAETADAGHTEACCDLAALAGLTPAAVLCEIMNADGTMARLPDLERFAAEHGLKISGRSPDGKFVEIAELPGHPWYLAVQFHPEFKSKPTRPHPLFASFVDASYRHKTANVRSAAESVA